MRRSVGRTRRFSVPDSDCPLRINDPQDPVVKIHGAQTRGGKSGITVQLGEVKRKIDVECFGMEELVKSQVPEPDEHRVMTVFGVLRSLAPVGWPQFPETSDQESTTPHESSDS
jgi:hypothetical protein